MSQFEHGFKSHCEKLSESLREELFLNRWDPLEMDDLAAHLAIEVMPITHTGAPDDVLAWAATGDGAACFSALTVLNPAGARVIVLNDSHEQPRRESNLAHELAHALLMHDLAPVFAENGDRTYESIIEQEANYLAGALLVPGPMARGIVKRGTPISEAAASIGVSSEMMKYRLQVTGALRAKRR